MVKEIFTSNEAELKKHRGPLKGFLGNLGKSCHFTDNYLKAM